MDIYATMQRSGGISKGGRERNIFTFVGFTEIDEF